MKLVKVSAFFVFLLLALAAPAFAEGAAAAVAPTATTLGAAPFDMGGSFFRMIGGTLFCIGVFGAGVHVYRKFIGQPTTGSKRRLKVIERLTLAPKTNLVLVSLDGRELLISVGPDQARLMQGQLPHSRQLFEESFADMYSMPVDEKRSVEGKQCVG
jgi:flagellar biogenesis protein FliO